MLLTSFMDEGNVSWSVTGVTLCGKYGEGICEIYSEGVGSESLQHQSSLPVIFSRIVMKLSDNPSVPPRFEPKNIVKPSRESVGRASLAAELIVGPRFVGVDQSAAVVSRFAV